MRRGADPPGPTPTEAFIEREFGDAIAFVADRWRSFADHSRSIDPDWERTFTLRQRLLAFECGPLAWELDANFPRIASLAAEADAETGFGGHEAVLLRGILIEGVISSGTNSREEVRANID
jgi:hypothetical protein